MSPSTRFAEPNLQLLRFCCAMLTQGRGSECTFSEYHCRFGLMCEGTWRQPGNEGLCQCDRLFGFRGAQCSDQSATTILFLTAIVSVATYAGHGLMISVRHAIKFYSGDIRRMSRSTGGRTLAFSFIIPTCTIVGSLGFGLHALRIDRKAIFVRYFVQPTFGLTIAGYASVTLSVSAFWLQAVEKARLMSSGENLSIMYSYPGAVVSAFSCVGILAVVLSWIYVRSNSMFPVVGALLQMIISSIYRVARQRIKFLLDAMQLTINMRIANGGDIPKIALYKIQAVAEKVQDFASFMSWNFAVLCFSFLLMACTLPAQKPLYIAQNELPPYLSGQIAGGLVSLTLFFLFFY